MKGKNEAMDYLLNQYNAHKQMEKHEFNMYTELLIGKTPTNIHYIIDTLAKEDIKVGRLETIMMYCDMYEIGFHHIEYTLDDTLKSFEYKKDLYATSMSLYELRLKHGNSNTRTE